MGGLPNDHNFGAIDAVRDPYLTQMETVGSRRVIDGVGCGGWI